VNQPTRDTSPLAAVEAQLLARGASFELAEEEILGERVRVFANRARSLRDVLLRAREFAGGDYMVFRDGERERRYTFSDHERLVASAAAALADRFGVGPGDRVAVLAANCPEWIISFWATVSLGAICVGLNGWWTEDEIRYAVDNSKPKLVIADRKRAARITGDLGVPMVIVENDLNFRRSPSRKAIERSSSTRAARPDAPRASCIRTAT
jgi:acyl-CoA synthetase (AMP-forming)/AMP-acid ligase II